MRCYDYEVESRVAHEGHASPEMVLRVKEHKATCVDCGGIRPSRSDLEAIFRDMFMRVGHATICTEPACKCKGVPPSAFEVEVVKQFQKQEGA